MEPTKISEVKFKKRRQKRTRFEYVQDIEVPFEALYNELWQELEVNELMNSDGSHRRRGNSSRGRLLDHDKCRQ